MKRFLNQMVGAQRGDDLDDFVADSFKVLSALAVVIGLGLEVASFVLTRPFDIQAFGIGFGALLLAAAGSLKLKAGTDEPPPATTTVDTRQTVVSTGVAQ